MFIESRGKLKTGQKPYDATVFYIQGDSGKYTVYHKRHAVSHRKLWTCDCPDFTNRQTFTGGTCKHIEYVKTVTSSEKHIAENPIMPKALVPVPWDVRTMCAPPVSPSLRQLVDEVVAFLNRGGEDAKRLWAILTGLRGPDNDNSTLKDYTTTRLRGLIGLRDGFGALVDYDNKPIGWEEVSADRGFFLSSGNTVRQSVEETLKATNDKRIQSHFLSHYAQALSAAERLGYKPEA